MPLRWIILGALWLTVVVARDAHAQVAEPVAEAPRSQTTELPGAKSQAQKSQAPVDRDDPNAAPRLLRDGNRKLQAGDPDGALLEYRKARMLRPSAPEIDFVEGLAEYDLGNYPEARRLFENAAAAGDDQLVNDAIYSVGTTYHREALANEQDPKASIESLENAMKRYQTVLSDQPDHAAARDANFKAAARWRQLKQQQEQQQQQQQQQQDDQENKDDEQQEQQQNEQQQQQDQQDQQEQQDQENQENQQQENNEQQQNESDSQDQQQQEQQQQQQEEEKQQQQQAQQQEDKSREQAERQLREMMQALRDRKKKQREKTRPIQIVPVEKDW
ncbi:MAG: tetratricopeptide repeat protein [Planctomycetota bacterium]